ncbi:signal transducer and activator of transcription 1-like isoform X2 [Gouania willdenowi]|uniref:signal transducer and activator of transcription 1-like isoform X2 n=1 Tax=Gouania willdenowi TaxID=441366 RepID=UPI0010544BF3|nr:signal transducer and activator of transcription 1-like isoform X2 [Gouania willdenowi]
MAQWEALMKLDSASQTRVVQLYENKSFNREIRYSLSGWIESQNWDEAAQDESAAARCFYDALNYLDQQEILSIQAKNILQGPNFSKMRDYFLNFQHDPLKLAMLLSECLKEEKKILDSALEAQSLSDPNVGHSNNELDLQIDQMKHQTLRLKNEIQTAEELNKNLDLMLKSFKSKVQHQIGLAQSHAVSQEQCLNNASVFSQGKIQAALELVDNIIEQAKQIVKAITDEEVSSWKRSQQMACIGSPVNNKLDHLQKWFTDVAKDLFEVCEQLEKLQNLKYRSSEASTAGLHELAQSLLTRLLSKALVVETQPTMHNFPHRPLILKTKARFKVTLRFLACLPGFMGLLKVKPVFDKDVEEVKTTPGFRLFDFVNSKSTLMNMNTQSGVLMAEFEDLSLVETKGRTKGSRESCVGVTEELHMITFVMTFQHGRYKYDIQTSSLPVLVVTSTNQFPKAWASIMWWNMLSTSEPWNLSLFADPPPIPWEQLSQALSWQFLSNGHRELEENQLLMIKGKILGGSESDLVDWNTFSKNNNTWLWIDGILDLIRKYLMTFWRDGLILGFVSREEACALLQEKPMGTFVLRFSESSLDGAITFSWVEQSNGEVCVHAVAPYSKKELDAKSLANHLHQYIVMREEKIKNPLCFLYPDIPIETIFKLYCKDSGAGEPGMVNGYLLRKSASISFPPTPPLSPSDLCHVDTEFDMDITAGNPLIIEDPALLDMFADNNIWNQPQDAFHSPTLWSLNQD